MDGVSPSGLDDLIGAIRARRAPADAMRPAIGDRAGRRWSRAELGHAAAQLCERLRARGDAGVLLLFADQSVESVAALLAGVAAGYQILLQPRDLDGGMRGRLEDAFRPDAIFEGGLTLNRRESSPVHPSPAILLSTSGTTGSAKFVRLPWRALCANARQIASVLRITPDDRGLAHLPLHYSYGLSILTSHLDRGAAVHLTDQSFTSADFWREAAEVGATHLPGVPFHYMFLARGALKSLVPASILTFTQAGGALPVPIRQRIHEAVSGRGGRFYVMYGQTEAAPRMTTLGHEDFLRHAGSVGKALSGGILRIVDEDGRECGAGEEGEVVYSGPNLMAGYVTARGGLSKPDEQLSELRTGDVGMIDREGYLTLRGRNRSFAKIGGLRLNLDDMAAHLTSFADVALLPGDEQVHVFYADGAAVDMTAEVRALARAYALPIGSFALHALPAIPRRESGKIDYLRLREMAG